MGFNVYHRARLCAAINRSIKFPEKGDHKIGVHLLPMQVCETSLKPHDNSLATNQMHTLSSFRRSQRDNVATVSVIIDKEYWDMKKIHVVNFQSSS